MTRRTLIAAIPALCAAKKKPKLPKSPAVCTQCDRKNLKSKKYPGISIVTAMGWTPYYDEDGKFHNEDPNVTTTTWRCSNGHRWVTEQRRGDLIDYREREE